MNKERGKELNSKVYIRNTFPLTNSHNSSPYLFHFVLLPYLWPCKAFLNAKKKRL